MQIIFLFTCLVFLLGCSSIRESLDIFGPLTGTEGISYGMTQEQIFYQKKRYGKEYEIIENQRDKLVLTEDFRILTFTFKEGRIDGISSLSVGGFISRKIFEERIMNGERILDELIKQGLFRTVSSQKFYFINIDRIKNYLKLNHPELKDAIIEIVEYASAK